MLVNKANDHDRPWPSWCSPPGGLNGGAIVAQLLAR